MRFIDKFLVALALLMFGQALVQAVVQRWDDFALIARRPPPSWQKPAPGAPADRPAPRTPLGAVPLPAASDHDPVVQVNPAPPRRADARSTGTAFAVGRDGAWLTAKHVVDGCARVLVRRGNAWDPAAVEFADPSADIAVLRARGGGPPLPVSAGPLALGEPGYAYGFAGQGGPSAIHAALLGRARTLQSGRLAGSTPVTAWAERAIVPPGERWIGGMSGGPLTTWEGSVVGIMSVASERRGRIYTVAPEAIAATVHRTGLRFAPPGAQPVAAGPATFDAARAELMNRRSVVQVLCTG
jgi:serine protease Do